MNIKFNIIKLRDLTKTWLLSKGGEAHEDFALDLLTELDRAENSGSVQYTINPLKLKIPFLEYLSTIPDKDMVTGLQLREITRILNAQGEQAIIDSPLPTSLRTLLSNLELLTKQGNQTYLKTMEQYYPVEINMNLESGYGDKRISVQCNAALIPDLSLELLEDSIYAAGLTMDVSEEDRMTIGDFIKNKLGLYLRPNEFNDEEFEEAVALAKTLYSSGKVLQGKGLGLISRYQYYRTILVEEDLSGLTLIAEPYLENDRNRGRSDKVKGVMLPIIRVFCLELKTYAFIDVRHVQEKVWDKSLLNHLFLPPNLKSLITSLFSVKQEELLKDIVKTKGNNLIIMASGGPGIGKTLTGEVYSALQERPLYILEVAEIGANVSDLEDKLKKVFGRIAQWDCVLLFDEADIFFQQRDSDLERSVIVGIFLRLLEQFKGILFLTTNRPDVIDKAFYSRVTVHLKYPELSESTRAEIWADKLRMAEVNLIDPHNIPLLSTIPLNGREIQNKIKIAKIVFNGNPVTCQEIYDLTQTTL